MSHQRFSFTVVVVAVVGISWATPSTAGAQGQGLSALVDRAPRVAVVSAFAPELERLRQETAVTRTVVLGGRTFTLGSLRGNRVVLFLSGISMVNAAMMTQTAIAHFNLQAIVVSGIAGGVDPVRHIGTVTVPSRWAQYQENLFARPTEGGYMLPLPFHTHDFGHFGFMLPQYVMVARQGDAPDSEQLKFWFDVDPQMLAVAEEAAGAVTLERCTPDGSACLSHEPTVAVGGRGVSGPTFVDNAEYREWVHGNFAAVALDMETAAIAHVAYTNRVPFIAFRSLSDLAGGGPGQNELLTFFQIAANNSATVVLAFLERWAGR